MTKENLVKRLQQEAEKEARGLKFTLKSIIESSAKIQTMPAWKLTSNKLKEYRKRVVYLDDQLKDKEWRLIADLKNLVNQATRQMSDDYTRVRDLETKVIVRSITQLLANTNLEWQDKDSGILTDGIHIVAITKRKNGHIDVTIEGNNEQLGYQEFNTLSEAYSYVYRFAQGVSYVYKFDKEDKTR